MELTHNTIINLMNSDTASPKISIYIPTHPKSSSQTINEDRIRFKNALQSIEHDPAFSDDDVKQAHTRLQRLLDDTDFWLHQAVSLAVFADADGYQAVYLTHEVVPYVCIDERFAVSPLVALASMSSSYYLLDVNIDGPALYVGTEYGLEDIGSEMLPGSMDKALAIDERKKSLDFRSGDARGNNMFYGHGGADEGRTNDIDKYLHLLADAVTACLSAMPYQHQLLLAGSASRVAQLRPLLSYPTIAAAQVQVDRDAMSVPELHQASRRVAAKQSVAERRVAVNMFRTTDAERTIDGSAAVIAAARQGKVDTLLLPILRMTTDGVDLSGSASALVELPQQMDDFETAVRGVVGQGGSVIAVEQQEFADDPTMKALLRF